MSEVYDATLFTGKRERVAGFLALAGLSEAKLGSLRPHYPSLFHHGIPAPSQQPAVGITVSPGSFYSDVHESFTLVEVQRAEIRGRSALGCDMSCI